MAAKLVPDPFHGPLGRIVDRPPTSVLWVQPAGRNARAVHAPPARNPGPDRLPPHPPGLLVLRQGQDRRDQADSSRPRCGAPSPAVTVSRWRCPTAPPGGSTT